MKKWLFGSLGVALLVALGVMAFLHTHEKKSTEDWIGLQGEARYNEFLAAEILLRRLEIDTDARGTLRPSLWLPPHKDTLLARLSPGFAAGDEAFLMMDWVADGGHLILLPPRTTSQDLDNFLAEFELRYAAVEHEPTSADAAAEPADGTGAAVDPDTEEESSEDYAYELGGHYSSRRIEATTENASQATVYDDDGINILRRPWGDGYLTVLADDSYFSNDSLEDQDHARLLLDIVAGYLEPGKVWFIYSAEFTPLWRILWNNAKYLLLGLALMFLLWLWARMPRFGPLAPSAPTARRSIIEHITATGEFGWREHGSAALARASANAVIHAAERLHPGIGRLAKEQQAEIIGRLTDLPAQDVLDALLVEQEVRAREFTQHIQILQTIRNEI